MCEGRRDIAPRLVTILAMEPRTRGQALMQVALVSAAWPRLSAHERKQVRVASERLAGLVDRRRDRATGRMLGVYRASEAGIESDHETPWALVCEEHGSCVCVQTRADAARVRCRDFCDDCREARP